MRLGTIVQRLLIAAVVVALIYDLTALALSTKCVVGSSREFIDVHTMYWSVCQVELTCSDGPWSGSMATRDDYCAWEGEVVRRSPIWRAPRYDGPLETYTTSLFLGILALVAYPAAGRWLNPVVKLTDADPDYR